MEPRTSSPLAAPADVAASATFVRPIAGVSWKAGFANPATYPLHPFLFAAASIFAPYAENLREVVPGDVAFPLVVVLLVALGLYLAAVAIMRTFGPPAAVLANIPLLAGIHYMDIVDRLYQWTGGTVAATDALPLILGGAAMLMLAVVFLRLNLILPNAILNGIALVLFVTPVWMVSRYVMETPAKAAMPPPHETAGFAAGERPDIYYLIFDRYASQRTLARDYSFDNGPFIDFLKDQGFYVAPDSRSNYLKTAPSLASTFHMDYINGLHGDASTAQGDWQPIYDMLDDHRVGRFVKAHGYKFIQLGAWWGPTQHNKLADESHSFGFTEFSWLYLRRTILPRLAEVALPKSRSAELLGWDGAQCRRVPLQFDKIKEISRRPEPTFTFAHLLLPHEPFVFRADGSCRGAEETGKIKFADGYVAQLEYANTKIRDMVTSLLATDGPPPVIIIQADEGPFPERYRTTNASWRVATERELQMKTGILNAIYLPDRDYSALSPDITSVNTFRLLFDKLFGTTFGRLPEHVYANPDVFHLYDFYDITKETRPPGS